MRRAWPAIIWWELRRPLFNIVLAALGIATTFIVILIGSNFVKEGDDFIEPMLMWVFMVFFGIGANIFYTIGWVSELLWSGGDTTKTEGFRGRVFWLGLTASSVVTLSPAVLMAAIWVIVRILGQAGVHK